MEEHPQSFEMESVNQIGIVVKDIDKVIESWKKLLGVDQWRSVIWDNKGEPGKAFKVRLAFTNIGPIQLELIQTLEGTSFYSSFIENSGEGIHHLGIQVDDVDAEVEKLVKSGMKVLSSRSGSFAYLDTQGPGGVMWELIRKPAKKA